MNFFCFSLAKSGHHAVMNWLMSHLSSVEWGNRKMVQFPEIGYVQGATITGNSLSEITSDRLKRRTQEFAHVFLNCENQRLTLDWDTVKMPREEICSVLILRDPFNNMASFSRHQYALMNSSNLGERRKGKLGSNSPQFGIKLWKKHAEEFLGTTNKLVNKICINFNLWFSSPEYRDAISEKIGGEPNVDILNYVASEGNGSMYDKFDFQDRAQEMDLFGRWKSADNKVTKLFDDEVFDLAEKIFGKDFVDPIACSIFGQ